MSYFKGKQKGTLCLAFRWDLHQSKRGVALFLSCSRWRWTYFRYSTS